MNTALTHTQEKLLTYIRSYVAEHGMSPTYNEIAHHFSCNPSSAYQTVEILVRKGYARHIKGISRGLTLTDTAAVELPDLNDSEYWYEGVFKHSLYQRDVVDAIKSAGMKVKDPS